MALKNQHLARHTRSSRDLTGMDPKDFHKLSEQLPQTCKFIQAHKNFHEQNPFPCAENGNNLYITHGDSYTPLYI